MSKFSYPLRLSLVGAGVAIGLVGILAAYFRRRRRKQPSRSWRRPTMTKVHHGDGDMVSVRSRSPKRPSRSRHVSVVSENILDDTNLSSVTVIAVRHDANDMTPDQLCDLGLDELQSAIGHWKEALHRLSSAIDEEDTVAGLQEQLEVLVAQAYRIQDHYEEQLFTDVQTSVAVDVALQQMDRDYEEQQRRQRRRTEITSMGDSSDLDSFFSAVEEADLTDLDEQQMRFSHLLLYEAGLEALKDGRVHCRTLRTKMCNCVSDTEFLAKLYCIRLAFDFLLKNNETYRWFVESGRQMISDLLTKADRDPEDFQVAFDRMMAFVKNEQNWSMMEEELRGRGVKAINFFDIVLDFILFDSFEDLANPPASISAVVHNRWLSNGFKETALSTAVWSVLKAKKRLLKFPKGFISHFYGVSEHISPLLVWGFLGPDDSLNDLCNFFKEHILQFIRDVFSFEKVAYTTVDQLSSDIHALARQAAVRSMTQLAPDR